MVDIENGWTPKHGYTISSPGGTGASGEPKVLCFRLMSTYRS